MNDQARELGLAVVTAVEVAVSRERQRCLRLTEEVLAPYDGGRAVPVFEVRQLRDDIRFGKQFLPLTGEGTDEVERPFPTNPVQLQQEVKP